MASARAQVTLTLLDKQEAIITQTVDGNSVQNLE
jgi:hypothetical protein